MREDATSIRVCFSTVDLRNQAQVLFHLRRVPTCYDSCVRRRITPFATSRSLEPCERARSRQSELILIAGAVRDRITASDSSPVLGGSVCNGNSYEMICYSGPSSPSYPSETAYCMVCYTKTTNFKQSRRDGGDVPKPQPVFSPAGATSLTTFPDRYMPSCPTFTNSQQLPQSLKTFLTTPLQ